jgi:hypothetical protein
VPSPPDVQPESSAAAARSAISGLRKVFPLVG